MHEVIIDGQRAKRNIFRWDSTPVSGSEQGTIFSAYNDDSAVSGHSKLTRPCPPCAPTSRLFFYIIPSYRSATMAALSILPGKLSKTRR